MSFLKNLFGKSESDKPQSETTNQLLLSFKEQAGQVFNKIVSDKRWDLNNELLFSVFGMTFYGYCFGLGRMMYFLEPADINSFVEDKLVGLGAGKKYVSGLVDHAYSTFIKPTEGINAQLVGIGHSHLSATDTTELVDSIFENAELLKVVLSY
ncbi:MULTISPECIES: hypothetical protein [unclassified Spirosoma]|uniref:hypothetical protein n=1 Tax=unclassified Spirosoma TaxID=2621999 RepID=UPI000959E20C|nr:MULTISPECIES: hypothetical protein [unclassified Spirosoma]MBN8820903.1 hypothetical protein [Spirosoma sp.]OJW75919.1 MAG: hypothetical protein BGO59_03540 [Spirosoma sp. 48-14]